MGETGVSRGLEGTPEGRAERRGRAGVTALRDGRALADGSRSGAVMEHERIVRSLLDAFNGRDLEGVLQLLHPRVTLRTVSALIFGDGLPYSGHEGIRRYFGDVERHWLELIVEPIHVRGAGDAVAALGVVRGRGRAPDFVLRDVPTSWLVRFRDNLVFELRVFSDRRAFEEVLTRALANRIETERVLPDGARGHRGRRAPLRIWTAPSPSWPSQPPA